MRAQNVGVAYVLFAVEHPTRFRVMVGYGVQSTHETRQARRRRARPRISSCATCSSSGLKAKRDEVIRDAEVLGWWSVVHGLAFLAIDGHLGKVGTSPKRAEIVVRQVIVAMDKHERAAGPSTR